MDRVSIEVGDKVLIKNWMGKKVVTITRVTKTKAVAQIKRADGTSYNYNFNRYAIDNRVCPKPYIDFDTTTRTLIKK